MLCGEAGTGKTTFINSMLDQSLLPHMFSSVSGIKNNTTVLTYNNPNASSGSALDYERDFQPERMHGEPGIAITETKFELIDEDNSKLNLSIIDTPGFGSNDDNSTCLSEITNFLQQQFDSVLAEETRVKRNLRFDDTRVHVCLYFVVPTGHGLRELDILAMKSLAKYCNIIPIVGRADTFTPQELQSFKAAVASDIEYHSVPVYRFDWDEEEDDADTIEENKALANLQPFAVIASEDKILVDGKLIQARRYPWGVIDVNDAKLSDFPIVKNVLLGSHLQDLKDLTHDFLYENYRTERLSGVVPENSRMADPPSLSNLAAVANSTSMATLSYPDQSQEFTDTGSTVASSTPMTPVKKSSAQFSNTNTPVKTPSTLQGSPSKSSLHDSPYQMRSPDPAKTQQLRMLSETVPYVLKHERILTRQQKLEELELRSARELALRAAALDRRVAEMKQREKLLQLQNKAKSQDSVASRRSEYEDTESHRPLTRESSVVKKEDTMTDLHSIISNRE